MSRLIDANLLRAEFTGNFHEMWHYTGIWAMIDCAPTAYDIDKVIEQLEATFDKWGLDDDKKSIMREIVKKGGGNDYQTNPMKAVKTTSLPVKSNLRR